ncbi:hypothetical protein CMV_029853 [Castanea mollissima]|uniref:Srp40 C-terminal domain-containing protein n=1 Tax=Castanea mollissima TaxID=60419 RepID=A0A8J4Q582_9ROSI|nr:hypothetical protein CMV_029853 [Castanea mollissima]
MPNTLRRRGELEAVDPILLALKPRQVVLNMNMKKPSTDHKPLLLQAVAHFLDRNGFSKTLKKFLSEAQLQKDVLKCSTLDLEDICYKYMETRNTGVINQNVQNTKADDSSKRDGECDSSVHLETRSKKNKKGSKSDNYAVVNQSGATGEIPDSKNSNEMITNDAALELNVRSKDKKKSKKISDSLGQGIEQVNTEISKEPADHILPESLAEEPDMKRKERKKKKSKLESGSVPGAIEEKYKELVSSEEIGVKSKSKKKRKDGLVSESVFGGNSKDLETEDVNGNNSDKNEFDASHEVVANEKKGSKKRKRLASEEHDFLALDKNAVEESERSEQPAKVNVSQGSEKANGNTEKNEEKSAFHKNKKQRNGSVEPKTITAFQRVKADDVVFTDERLKDNSYWAKDGAENGYGAKAQEILGQVRGRDFRHEKTKKKRGTYRGGQIDLQSHSIKFNYSDDE